MHTILTCSGTLIAYLCPGPAPISSRSPVPGKNSPSYLWKDTVITRSTSAVAVAVVVAAAVVMETGLYVMVGSDILVGVWPDVFAELTERTKFTIVATRHVFHTNTM